MIIIIISFAIVFIVSLLLIYFFKRDISNPYESKRSPEEVLLEAMEMMKSDENKFSPLKYIRIWKYVRQETGMSLVELQKYINNLDESDVSTKQSENQSKKK